MRLALRGDVGRVEQKAHELIRGTAPFAQVAALFLHERLDILKEPEMLAHVR